MIGDKDGEASATTELYVLVNLERMSSIDQQFKAKQSFCP